MRFGIISIYFSNRDDKCYPAKGLSKRRVLLYTTNIFEGGLFAYKENDVDFEELITYFLSYNFFPLKFIFKTPKIDACISLLALPYFDELYQFVKSNYRSIDKTHLKVLKSRIFDDYGSDYNHSIIMGWGRKCLDTPYYIEHQCHEKSKEIITLINSVLD